MSVSICTDLKTFVILLPEPNLLSRKAREKGEAKETTGNEIETEVPIVFHENSCPKSQKMKHHEKTFLMIQMMSLLMNETSQETVPREEARAAARVVVAEETSIEMVVTREEARAVPRVVAEETSTGMAETRVAARMALWVAEMVHEAEPRGEIKGDPRVVEWDERGNTTMRKPKPRLKTSQMTLNVISKKKSIGALIL